MFLLDDLIFAAIAAQAATAATAATAGAGALGALGAGAAATGAGALGAGALGTGAAMAAPELAAMTAAPSVGGLSGLLSQAPALTTAMQNTGLLGSVVDATGGLATSTTAANNIGGGLLGNASRGVTSFMSSPNKLLKAGQLLAGPDKQQQQMPQAQPFSFQSQPTNLSQQAQPGMSEQEKRRRMLMQIFQGG